MDDIEYGSGSIITPPGFRFDLLIVSEERSSSRSSFLPLSFSSNMFLFHCHSNTTSSFYVPFTIKEEKEGEKKSTCTLLFLIPCSKEYSSLRAHARPNALCIGVSANFSFRVFTHPWRKTGSFYPSMAVVFTHPWRKTGSFYPSVAEKLKSVKLLVNLK